MNGTASRNEAMCSMLSLVSSQSILPFSAADRSRSRRLRTFCSSAFRAESASLDGTFTPLCSLA